MYLSFVFNLSSTPLVYQLAWFWVQASALYNDLKNRGGDWLSCQEGGDSRLVKGWFRPSGFSTFCSSRAFQKLSKSSGHHFLTQPHPSSACLSFLQGKETISQMVLAGMSLFKSFANSESLKNPRERGWDDLAWSRLILIHLLGLGTIFWSISFPTSK
jgi:hypothetical protein